VPKSKTGGKPVTKNVPLADITAAKDVQARVALNEGTVGDYGAAMLERTKFPPCVVFDDGKTKWLSDGFHRYTAAIRTGGKVTHLLCELRKGSKRDAQLFALGANATHGLRRTSADKRKAVSVMLRDIKWKEWSSSEIARHCNVSHTFVDNVRSESPSSNVTCNVASESPPSSLTTVVSESPNQASAGAPAEHGDKGRKYRTKHGTESVMRKRRARKKEASDKENEPEEETEPALPVAGPDREGSEHVDTIGFMTGKRIQEDSLPIADREERPDQDERKPDTSPVAGSDQIEVGREDVAKLMTEKRALEAKIEDQAATSSALQSAESKWRDAVETQRGIIAQKDNEIANLRAGPEPTEPQNLLQWIERALDGVEQAHQVANTWPDKPPDRERRRGEQDLRDIATCLRGLRERLKLYSEKDAAPERYH
jgi:hypothetical protein